jgi:putative transposase
MKNTEKEVKSFLNKVFCVVGHNSPYQVTDFMHVLLDAVEHTDFTNNTCVRVGGPTGETVFSRVKNADFSKIKTAFFDVLERVCPSIKRLLRNRKVGLAFDTTDEPYYGKVEGFYVHPYRPVRGSTGCFKYITVSVIERNNRLILGSLPVRIGADIVSLVTELIERAKKFFVIDVVLFDRGFVDYRLVEALQRMCVRYQIFWRKDKRTNKILKKMKRGQLKENTYVGKYSRDKSTFKVKTRFVYLKKYKRHKKSKAYSWVFATNVRYKSQRFYVDKYRKRWSIETTFRVLDNIQIKTTTKNEVIRYFINIFCCLVYNLWRAKKVLENKITLKNFVTTVKEVIKTILQERKAPDD